MADLSYISENINKLLNIRNMSQAELARRTHSGNTTVNTWCSGNKLPSLSALSRIAEALGVGMDDLVMPITGELSGEKELTEPCEHLYADLFGIKICDMPLNSKTLLNNAIEESLSEPERYVLEHRYGLNGCAKETLNEIAQKMDVSCERVRQIGDKAKANLQKKKYMLLPDSKLNLTGCVPNENDRQWADKVPLGELNLSTRVQNCMRKNGVQTLGDVLRLKDTEIAGMKGLGPQSIMELNRLRRLVWSNEDMGTEILSLI